MVRTFTGEIKPTAPALPIDWRPHSTERTYKQERAVNERCFICMYPLVKVTITPATPITHFQTHYILRALH